MSEIVEPVEMAEKTKEVGPTGLTHTVLEIWKSLLSNLEASEEGGMEFRVAGRLVARSPHLKFSDMELYSKLYHGFLREYRDILDVEIEKDKDAFKHVADDAEENREHYLNLLVQWQMLAEQQMKDWSSSDENAGVSYSAISDAANVILGDQGMLSQLEAINFEITDDEAEMIGAAVFGVEG